MSDAGESREDPWLTEREAAEELRVSIYVVRAERLAERLGYARLRRRIFYPKSLIDAYKASLICPATSSSGSTPSPGATISHGRSAGAPSAASPEAAAVFLLTRS